MAAERNQALTNVLILWRRYQRGEITADSAFRSLVYGELAPKEKDVFKYLVNNPETSAAEIAKALKLSHVHAATIVHDLYNRGLLQRKTVYEDHAHGYIYRVKE